MRILHPSKDATGDQSWRHHEIVGLRATECQFLISQYFLDNLGDATGNGSNSINIMMSKDDSDIIRIDQDFEYGSVEKLWFSCTLAIHRWLDVIEHNQPEEGRKDPSLGDTAGNRAATTVKQSCRCA